MNSELKQAQELNEESRQFRYEAQQALEKSRKLQDEAIRLNQLGSINLRRVGLAVSSLLPSRLRKDFNLSESDIENTAEVSQEHVEAIKQREVFDIVHAINVLAMANTDVIHIFVHFSAHINSVAVFVHATGHDYKSGDKSQRLLDKKVWLSHDYALKRLLSIESQLTELIIEAREEAEANAEVEA
ncbi:hypothetical protein [Vibrio nigripulchritudo]|uniref:hypothetical protein n=1 Tax=Vibrio nigripulchritudo TaxID=28173 RepID=UPI0005FA1B9C|nr:hypothetical protein TW74_09575 [Vibrio nigripulchritudo]